MRSMHLVAISVLLLAVLSGCTSGAEDTTTTTSTTLATTSTSAETSTTTVRTTTTTSPTTTSPTTTTPAIQDPWAVDYPLEADTVDDLPGVLTDKIVAPEPDPDLTIEGPDDDLGRWVDEWLNWFSWVNANPAEGSLALDHAVVPGGVFYEDTVAALDSRQEAGERLLGYAFRPIDVSGTFDEFFERGELLRLVVGAEDTIPRYVIDSTGSVVTIHEPLGGETTLRLLLRYVEGEGEWILESLEVVG